MAIEVFNRCEKKYLLSQKQYEDIVALMQHHMEYDVYNKDGRPYRICNIYYDTADDELIRKSISKPVYKEKLRVRSYGKKQPDEDVFVEIKKKYKGIVNKRRTSVKLSDAYQYLSGYNDMDDVIKNNPGVNRQVLCEIDYLKTRYKIEPKVYLSYDRVAYVCKEDKDFRLTIDSGITVRRDNVGLHLDSFGKRLLPDGVYLMEVKVSGAVPLWFAHILSQLKIYPVSFSKYGTEYVMHMKEIL